MTSTECGSLFFARQYQLAYVTADMARARSALRAEFGATWFLPLPDDGLVDNEVWTPEGRTRITMRVALAEREGTTLEILQPVAGATGVFDAMLPVEHPLRLHHVAMRCADVDVIRAEHESRGRKVVMAGSFGPARFVYVDATSTLGHYLEYVAAPFEYWERRDGGAADSTP